jgi:GntR family transcriptional regulator/MocR family aminotransferase
VDFELTIERERNVSAQIYRALRSAILGGRLRPGQGLPSSRELASQLCVARKTVLRAYERLSRESLIEGRTGSGTVVCAGFELPRNLPKQASVLLPRPEYLRVSPYSQQPERAVKFDFRIAAASRSH